MRTIELLAPARDADTAILAIECGADAVYIGAPSHGARAAATNSLADIERVVKYAHRFGVRVYVTVNTIIYDKELAAVERMIHSLYRIGVDALIVQDMGLLRMKLPPIALHASTQCDTRDAAKAKFLEDVGFSQIVLARELSLEQIRQIHDTVKVPLEVFVHGALCVSYSGDCHASWALKHRSANRGECAQICRLPWRLEDAEGKEVKVAQGRHLLSLRDMNRYDNLEALLEAGVSSFKIEGRLKDGAYVKNVVMAYRRRLDKIIAANPDKYRRQSFGETVSDFTPSLANSFNRGYTDYFLAGTPKPGATSSIASMASPKSIGTAVGKVVSSDGKRIEATLTQPLANGDGLGYFTPEGVFVGFRLNRVEGRFLFPASKVNIAPGTVLWRNRSKGWDDMIANTSVRREIALTMRLTPLKGYGIALEVEGAGHAIKSSLPIEYIKANTPQTAQRERVLGKLGDTCYRLAKFDDQLGDQFVPAAELTRLRRQAIATFDRMICVNHRFEYRRTENLDAKLPNGQNVTYHDNVANRLARKFYTDHGAETIEMALETLKTPVQPDTRVMTTRYCLRRELGACLRTPDAAKLPNNLYLTSGNLRLRLHFDCPHCQMQLHT